MERAVVPKEVANYIAYCKTWGLSISSALKKACNILPEYKEWIHNNSDEFAKAWVNGYTIKEKYYYIAIPVGSGKYKLVMNCNGLTISSGNYESIEEVKECTKLRKYNITEKMIKKSEISWVWQFAKELED